MSKLDQMRRSAGANIGESMGEGRVAGAGYSPPSAASVPARLQGLVKSRNAAEIPIDRIGPDPDQPREEFEPEALERLADSLRTRGQLQPIRVRWDEARSQYVIICGERRWRAAMQAGLSTLSCVVSESAIDPGELLALQLVENALREDLKPIEQARAFRALMDRNGWTARQVARELAYPQSTLVKILELLELPTSVQEQVERGNLAVTTAYELRKIDDATEQAAIAERITAENLTRQEAGEIIEQARASRPEGSRKGRAGGKGRGGAKGKPRKITAETFRTPAGRVVVENKRGLEPSTVVEALEAALATAPTGSTSRPRPETRSNQGRGVIPGNQHPNPDSTHEPPPRTARRGDSRESASEPRAIFQDLRRVKRQGDSRESPHPSSSHSNCGFPKITPMPSLRQSVPLLCSTPGGVIVGGTTRANRPGRLRSCSTPGGVIVGGTKDTRCLTYESGSLLNARRRHCRGHGTASTVYGLDDDLLNARRRHCRGHWTSRRLYHSATCPAQRPEASLSGAPPRTLLQSITLPACSTPGGVIVGGTPISSRRRRPLSICSTPGGVIVGGTLTRSRRQSSRAAQRPEASLSGAPPRGIPPNCPSAAQRPEASLSGARPSPRPHSG